MQAKAAEIYNSVYPGDAGVTTLKDRKNSLNRMISYHMLDRQVIKRMLIQVYVDPKRTKNYIESYPMHEYLETMCENTLLKITHISNQRTNLFNYISSTNYTDLLFFDGEAVNGVFHEVSDILSFNREFISFTASQRLRLDFASLFPEFTNNDYR